MKKFGENKLAISPVIGVILMVAVTVIMASTIAASVFLYNAAAKAPYAVIEIKEAKGGLYSDNPLVKYENNLIVLVHKGGAPLEINNTKIKIDGYGNAQNISFNPPFGITEKGNLYIEYINMGFSGKTTNPGYIKNNPELRDGYWSAGEKLVLNGEDSINGSDSSTVKVLLEKVSKTSNNWGLSQNMDLTLSIIDIPSHQLIAKLSISMNHR